MHGFEIGMGLLDASSRGRGMCLEMALWYRGFLALAALRSDEPLQGIIILYD